MPHEPVVEGHNDEDPSASVEFRLRKDDRLTVVAHEVRTPLTVIRGQAQLLARLVRRSELPESQRVRLLGGLARIDTSVSELLASLERASSARATQEQESPPPEVAR
jgi:signal transduction histidine kinase